MARSLTQAEKRLVKIFSEQSKRRQKKSTPRVRAAVRRAKEKMAAGRPKGARKPTALEDQRQQERISGALKRGSR